MSKYPSNNEKEVLGAISELDPRIELLGMFRCQAKDQHIREQRRRRDAGVSGGESFAGYQGDPSLNA
jgi:hypothetical protein